MKAEEEDWRAHVEEFNNNDMLIANCIASSAYIVYCSSMNTDTRKRMGEFFMQICGHHGIPMPSRILFNNIQLVDFLAKPVSHYFTVSWMNFRINAQ